jgi:hypothetical protein
MVTTPDDETIPDIDWAPLAPYGPSSMQCLCGGEWRSLGKVVHVGTDVTPSGLVTVARQPCPQCGYSTRIVAMRGDPEVMTL